MVLLAHSAQNGVGEQAYRDHVSAVHQSAIRNAWCALAFFAGPVEQKNAISRAVDSGALLHDLGKLDEENQRVLAKTDYGGKLPINHVDAGTAMLWGKGAVNGAILVYCHHRGLFSYDEEVKKQDGKLAFRDPSIAEMIDGKIEEYVANHRNEILLPDIDKDGTALKGLSLRIALSCLVDADHSDTASHYGGELPEVEGISPRWNERLGALNRYVAQLSETADKSERNRLRDEVYQACLNASVAPDIKYCDAPVGTGKTTAVMAHLLRAASQKNLRHIFIVLPYTNIIEQSVKVYREAVVLEGENAEDAVAAHYHQADFSDFRSRQLAVLWRAPIIVTSAVQFFETLAGARTSRLRKLHEVPGSAVFLDEAHAAIPLHQWPQQWDWIRELVDHWGCQFVFASGSLIKFWEHSSIAQSDSFVPSLLPEDVRKKVVSFEGQRVVYPARTPPMNRDQLVEFVLTKPGPRLVILNTVQSAAIIAHEMKNRGYNVLHLSTALTPRDRGRVVELVSRMLQHKSLAEWTLVATSCVEAGVDFSFRTVFRESCSVASLIQSGGRANRHGESRFAEVIDFRTRDPFLNKHPAFDVSRTVLDQIFDESLFENLSPIDVTTEAIFRELARTDVLNRAQVIKKKEDSQEYREVEKLCRVIDADTRTVVINPTVINKLENREKVTPVEILQNSVQLWSNKIQKLGLQEFRHIPELFYWSYPYDPLFLGYMEGLLPMVYEYEDDEYGLVI